MEYVTFSFKEHLQVLGRSASELGGGGGLKLLDWTAKRKYIFSNAASVHCPTGLNLRTLGANECNNPSRFLWVLRLN